jgi:hypothetical protein
MLWFWSPLRAVWGPVKQKLSPLLKEKSSVITRRFKDLLSATIDDLIKALQEKYFATDVWRHTAKAHLKKKGDTSYSATVLTVAAFPIEAIIESKLLADGLAKRILENLPLDAIRTDARIEDAQWQSIVTEYASSIVRHGLPIALRRMISQELPIHSSEYVIDLAELEPLRVKGTAGHHTVVVLYEKPYSKDKPTVSQARKIWSNRTSGSYDREIGDYDGFKAT